MFDPQGQLRGYQGTDADISARRLSDEALRASESRLRAITESAQDAILMMDGSGNVSYWNPAAERILGHSAAEVAGRNLHDLIVPQRFHAALLPAYRAFLQTGEGAA